MLLIHSVDKKNKCILWV